MLYKNTGPPLGGGPAFVLGCGCVGGATSFGDVVFRTNREVVPHQEKPELGVGDIVGQRANVDPVFAKVTDADGIAIFVGGGRPNPLGWQEMLPPNVPVHHHRPDKLSGVGHHEWVGLFRSLLLLLPRQSVRQVSRHLLEHHPVATNEVGISEYVVIQPPLGLLLLSEQIRRCREEFGDLSDPGRSRNQDHPLIVAPGQQLARQRLVKPREFGNGVFEKPMGRGGDVDRVNKVGTEVNLGFNKRYGFCGLHGIKDLSLTNVSLPVLRRAF